MLVSGKAAASVTDSGVAAKQELKRALAGDNRSSGGDYEETLVRDGS